MPALHYQTSISIPLTSPVRAGEPNTRIFYYKTRARLWIITFSSREGQETKLEAEAKQLRAFSTDPTTQRMLAD